MEADAIFGEIRSALAHEPSEEGWARICELLDLFGDPHDPRLVQECLPYLARRLARWPASMRQAPQHWTTPKALRDPPPALQLAQRWSCYGRALGAVGFGVLAKSPYLEGVVELDLHGARPGNRGLLSLAESAYLRQVEVLDIGGAYAPPEHLPRLLRRDVLPALRELVVGDVDPRGLLAGLVACELAEQLEVLSVGAHELREASMRMMCFGPWRPRLRELHLRNTLIFQSDLAEIWRLPALEALRSDMLVLDAVAAEGLLDSPPPRLRVLELRAITEPACLILRDRWHAFNADLQAAIAELPPYTDYMSAYEPREAQYVPERMRDDEMPLD